MPSVDPNATQTPLRAPDLRPWTHELARKSVHMAVSLAAIAVIWFLPTTIARILFLAAAAVAIAIDVLRLRVPAVKQAFEHYFAPLLRVHESRRITGATTLALGVAIAGLLFPRNFAIAGLLFAGLGDAAGAIVGRKFGRHRFRSGKTLEGSFAFFCVALIVGWAMPGIGFIPGLAAALLVTPIEAGRFSFDDNLILPTCGATATWIAVALLG